MDNKTKAILIEWAEKYNNPEYFKEDPIAFPTRFSKEFRAGKVCLQDVEISAIFSAHLAWGRRAMIVRDCGRLFDEMNWKPYDYVMSGEYRNDPVSCHRTIKWSEIALICERLKKFYEDYESIEILNQDEIRTKIYGQKSDAKAPNKKINMLRRWMVRNDGKVDLGLWKNSDPKDLLIPLDVHVHNVATELKLTSRTQKDIKTVLEITESFNEIFPGDPCKGDFSLFGYGVTHSK